MASVDAFGNVSFGASIMDGVLAVGGKIIITPEHLIFHPHAFNFDNGGGDRYFPISEIVGYKKGFLTHLTVYWPNGYSETFVVWKKGKVISELEKRRIAYYQQRGLPVPQLLRQA